MGACNHRSAVRGVRVEEINAGLTLIICQPHLQAIETFPQTFGPSLQNRVGRRKQEEHGHGAAFRRGAGMAIRLAWTYGWHGHTAGMDIRLAWTYGWHGHTAGMAIRLAWPSRLELGLEMS